MSAQSCPALCNPCKEGSQLLETHGISQARILEWVVISSSRAYSQLRGQTHVSSNSCIGRQIFLSLSHLGGLDEIHGLFHLTGFLQSFIPFIPFFPSVSSPPCKKAQPPSLPPAGWPGGTSLPLLPPHSPQTLSLHQSI